MPRTAGPSKLRCRRGPASRTGWRPPLRSQASGGDLAPEPSAEGMSPLPSGGTVEGGDPVAGVQPVEVQVHRQEVKGAGSKDAEELLVRGRLVEAVLVHHHGLGPKARDDPVEDPNKPGPALEGAGTWVSRPARPAAGTRDHSDDHPAAYARLSPSGIMMSAKPLRGPTRRRTPFLPPARSRSRASELFPPRTCGNRSHVEVSAQSEPREEVGVGLFGLRGAELEVPEILPPLPGLPTDAQPHGPVSGQGDELQPVPEVVGLAQIDPPQDRPVFVEPSG